MERPRDDMTPGERLAHQLLDAMDFDGRFDRRYERVPGGPGSESPQDPMREQLKAMHEIRRSIVTPALIRPRLFESPVGKKFVEVWGSDHGPVRDVLTQASKETREQYRKLFEQTLDKQIPPADH